MSELSFLSNKPNSADLWEASVLGKEIEDPLTPSQIEKIKITTDYLMKSDESKREAILTELGCQNSKGILMFIKKYETLLKSKKVSHNLVDFDWSASFVLGTNKISNLNVPIVTFSFILEDGTKKLVEFTEEEAEVFLKQLESAKKAQQDLLPK